jgi:hypothetical protein
MKTLTTSANPTAVDDRRLGRLRHQGLRLPLGLRPLLVGRRLGHNIHIIILALTIIYFSAVIYVNSVISMNFSY